MVTQQFHETLEPLSEWLAATEKYLINSEPIGTETSKLEDQISQHKVKMMILLHVLVFIQHHQLWCVYFSSICFAHFIMFSRYLPFSILVNFFLFVFIFCFHFFPLLIHYLSLAIRP